MGTKTEEYLKALAGEGELPEAGCCMTTTQSLIYDAAVRVNALDEDVQELKNNPDVVDIVDTYADLQAYDTQHLTNNDIIRVLNDETHGGNSTYYRLTKNPDTWTFIGEIPSEDLSNYVYSTHVHTIWSGTQAQYDTITNKDNATLYIITGA